MGRNEDPHLHRSGAESELSLNSVVSQRLANQYVTRTAGRDPAKLVAWFGAMQAQEFGPAKWAIGLRLPAGITDAKIQRAIDAGRILRTPVMRPTWHFVTPKDIGWMLELSAARVHRLGLDSSLFTRAATVCERVLRDGQFLTRRELAVHFAGASLSNLSDQHAANNQRSATVTVATSPADIALANITAPGQVTVGDTVPIVVTVQNVGGEDASTSFDVVLSAIPIATRMVGFSVTGMTLAGAVYKPVANHDPDGSSNGYSITVKRL